MLPDLPPMGAVRLCWRGGGGAACESSAPFPWAHSIQKAVCSMWGQGRQGFGLRLLLSLEVGSGGLEVQIQPAGHIWPAPGLDGATARNFFPSCIQLCFPKSSSLSSWPLATFSSKSLVFVPFIPSNEEKKVRAACENYRIRSNVYKIGI